MHDLTAIVSQFAFTGRYLDAEVCTNGHINHTYFLDFNQAGKKQRYVLQQINHQVFKEPEQVMANIVAVTKHLRKKVLQRGGDPAREALQVILTRDGNSVYQSPDGKYWRAYDYIQGARTYQKVEDPIHFYHAGRSFGQFQLLLSDFPANKLHETILCFHDTRKRFTDFRTVVDEDRVKRKSLVQSEIDFILERSEEAGIIVDLMAAGEIPLRVTHNDTKFNNIMIDDHTGEGICVLDLDTVMPGSSLYDYGDAIRFGASTAEEDETDLALVSLDINLFRKFTEGYLEEASSFLNAAELRHLAFSAKLMTLETALRFLQDYLYGDVYFRVERPEQNLDRARTQIKLVQEMEANMEQMEAIIAEILNENQKGCSKCQIC